MMYNYRKYLYLLRHAYFHPSRNDRYPSEAVKDMTFRAMQMLWQLDGLYALGKFFDEDEIHRLLIEELMPDDVDMALSYFLHRCYDGSVYTLALLIFHAMLLRDEVYDDMLRAHFPEWYEKRSQENSLCHVTVQIRFAS